MKAKTTLALVAALVMTGGAWVAPASAGLGFDEAAYNAVDSARPEMDKARDKYRHPKGTLEFFGIGPETKVVEVLPGGGWYTRILLPLVAEKGAFAGLNYDPEMMKAAFGDRMTEERLEGARKWPETYPAKAAEFVEGTPEINAWNFGSVSEDAHGTYDAVLFIRALHNMSRAEGEWRANALKDAYNLLKPGGVVGVVQHRAPDDAEGALASGSAGYLVQEDVIAAFEEAGFKLDAISDINANPMDKPEAGDIVWRLQPSLRGPDETKEAMKAIGESNRMTLKFVKPAE